MRPASSKVTLGRILTLALLVAAMLGIPAGRAEAEVAMGPYLDTSGGSGTLQWDRDNYDFDVDVSSAAIGFALNNGPTTPENFNYRLNLGVEAQNLDDDYDSTLKMSGVVLENVLGLALLRQPNMRWWAGPLVRIGYYSGETDDHHRRSGDRYKTEADLFEYGIGFATGLNFRIGRHTYLAPSAGIRYIKATGSGTFKNLDSRTQYDDDLSGHLTNFFVNCALLFD